MLKNPASVVLTSNSILNGDPAASLTRRRAQTWRSPYLSHRKPQRATPPVPSSAAALLEELLSILRDYFSLDRQMRQVARQADSYRRGTREPIPQRTS